MVSAFYQDFDDGFPFAPQAERMGVPGFEKFLLILLLGFSLFWVFYLRHLAPLFLPDHKIAISVEIFRPKVAPVPSPAQPFPDQIATSKKTAQPGSKVEPPPDTASEAPLVSEPERVEPKTDPKALIDQTVELYEANRSQSELDEITDFELEKFRPDNVFDPRLAEKLAHIRQKKDTLRQVRGGLSAEESYIDNMGVLNYRKGNTCFQIIEIPGIGYQWYGSKCAITQYEMEFEFNGKRY